MMLAGVSLLLVEPLKLFTTPLIATLATELKSDSLNTSKAEKVSFVVPIALVTSIVMSCLPSLRAVTSI